AVVPASGALGGAATDTLAAWGVPVRRAQGLGEREGGLVQTLLVDLQGPALAVPVAEDDAPGALAIHVELVFGRAMGMAVDQGAHTMPGHDPRHLVGGHVDDLAGLHAGLRAALATQLARQLVAGGERQMAQDEQAERVAQ